MPSKPAIKSSVTGLYRPHLTSPEKRTSTTVAREYMIKDTVEQLRHSATRSSKHHFLFLGPRGIGKSHLLSLVEDKIATDDQLKSSYCVVRFPEEANRLLTFADFLLGVVEILRDVLLEESFWAELYTQLATEEDDMRIVDTIVPRLRHENRYKRRTLLIMLENLNQLFGIKMRGSVHVAAMRKFFMGDNGCMLMATAPVHFDAITSVDEPFYDFFDTQILEHLTEEDTITLIRRNLEWDKRRDLLKEFETMRPKLRAIYQMTAGNPRLTMMLYNLIAHDAITEVRAQLEALLDHITPFYQDRLNDLSPQEQAVLETIAVMRDTEKTPNAIAARMRMAPQHVSVLLKRLSETHYLRSTPHPDDKRRRLYVIREGFFDIWFAMNMSRKARQNIPFLLDFFAIFYPSLEEREKKRRKLREKLNRQDDSDTHADIYESLSILSDVEGRYGQTETKPTEVLYLNEERAKYESSRVFNEVRKFKLDKMGEWIVKHSSAGTDYLNELEEMTQCWQMHRSGNLEAFSQKLLSYGQTLTYKNFSKIKLEFLRDQLSHMKKDENKIRLRISIIKCLNKLAQWKTAEEQLMQAKQECPRSSNLYSIILNNLGHLLRYTNRLTEAENILQNALAIDISSYGSKHPFVTNSMNNLALVFQDTNRFTEAENMLQNALAICKASYGSEDPNVATLMNNLGRLLRDTNRFTEAENMLRDSLAIYEASYGSKHPFVATSMNNLALVFQDTNRLDEAENMLQNALVIYEDSYGSEHPFVAINLKSLALVFKKTNRLSQAEQTMKHSILILFKSQKQNDYEYYRLKECIGIYTEILTQLKFSPDNIEKQIKDLKIEAGLSVSE